MQGRKQQEMVERKNPADVYISKNEFRVCLGRGTDEALIGKGEKNGASEGRLQVFEGERMRRGRVEGGKAGTIQGMTLMEVDQEGERVQEERAIPKEKENNTRQDFGTAQDRLNLNGVGRWKRKIRTSKGERGVRQAENKENSFGSGEKRSMGDEEMSWVEGAGKCDKKIRRINDQLCLHAVQVGIACHEWPQNAK